MVAKQVTWWLCLLYIFITKEFRYLGLRKAATPKYLDQVNLILKTFQWPWFRSYNTFGSNLVWSEYLVHLNHILTPTFEHFDTIRPWAWLYQRIQVHVWTKYLGLNLKMTPKILYQSLDHKILDHLDQHLTLICNTKIWGVNLVLNHLFRMQSHSDIWIIIPRWRCVAIS